MSSFANNVILLWFFVITFLPCSWGQECSIEQKRALLEIRNATNGSVFADWGGRDCCNAPGITCDGIDGGVSSIYLQSDNAPSSTWYPNVTLFTIFDELEQLRLNGMNIGGELKRENSNSISPWFTLCFLYKFRFFLLTFLMVKKIKCIYYFLCLKLLILFRNSNFLKEYQLFSISIMTWYYIFHWLIK